MTKSQHYRTRRVEMTTCVCACSRTHSLIAELPSVRSAIHLKEKKDHSSSPHCIGFFSGTYSTRADKIQCTKDHGKEVFCRGCQQWLLQIHCLSTSHANPSARPMHLATYTRACYYLSARDAFGEWMKQTVEYPVEDWERTRCFFICDSTGSATGLYRIMNKTFVISGPVRVDFVGPQYKSFIHSWFIHGWMNEWLAKISSWKYQIRSVLNRWRSSDAVSQLQSKTHTRVC